MSFSNRNVGVDIDLFRHNTSMSFSVKLGVAEPRVSIINFAFFYFFPTLPSSIPTSCVGILLDIHFKWFTYTLVTTQRGARVLSAIYQRYWIYYLNGRHIQFSHQQICNRATYTARICCRKSFYLFIYIVVHFSAPPGSDHSQFRFATVLHTTRTMNGGPI
jgi:hypothetical protein